MAVAVGGLGCLGLGWCVRGEVKTKEVVYCYKLESKPFMGF